MGKYNPSGTLQAIARKVLRTRTSLLVLAVAVTLIAGMTFMAGAYNRSSPSPPGSVIAGEFTGPLMAKSTLPPTASKAAQRPKRIETEIITMLPNGFEPMEIVRSPGHFVLMVDNRSGIPDVSLLLDRESGPRVLAVQVERSKLDWNDVVDLAPGRYLLTEAGHPEWVCILTITDH